MDDITFRHLVTSLCGLVIFLFNDANGLHCFQCNSLFHKDCFDLKPNNTSSKFYKECVIPKEELVLNGTPTYRSPYERFCRKTYQKIFKRGGLEVIERKCAWNMLGKQDCYYSSNTIRQEAVCQCFSDGCNSSRRNTVSFPAIFVIPVIMFYNMIHISSFMLCF